MPTQLVTELWIDVAISCRGLARPNAVVKVEREEVLMLGRCGLSFTGRLWIQSAASSACRRCRWLGYILPDKQGD